MCVCVFKIELRGFGVFGERQRPREKQGQVAVHLGGRPGQRDTRRRSCSRSLARGGGENSEQRRRRPRTFAAPRPPDLRPVPPWKHPSRSSGEVGRPAGLSWVDPQCKGSRGIHPAPVPGGEPEGQERAVPAGMTGLLRPECSCCDTGQVTKKDRGGRRWT